MKASEKTKLILGLGSDINYLRDELERKKLWASLPDGFVDFNTLLDYLSDEDNVHFIEHVIKVAKEIKELEK